MVTFPLTHGPKQSKWVPKVYIYVIFFAGTPQQREGYSVSLNIFENLAYQKAHVSIFHRHQGHKIHGIGITTKMKAEAENILPGNQIMLDLRRFIYIFRLIMFLFPFSCVYFVLL